MTLSFLNDANLVSWVRTLGYFGVALIVFAETGFFFCFFLPGDSLLFATGMLAGLHVFNIYLLIPLLIVAAFLGYWAGYYLGFYFGKRLERHHTNKWYYKKSYVDHAHAFLQKYGKVSLLLGRLVAVVRGFLPLIAGMGKMPIRVFMVYNFLGAVIWCLSMPLLGFYLGKLVPNIGEYLLLVVIAIIVLSLLPGLLKVKKNS